MTRTVYHNRDPPISNIICKQKDINYQYDKYTQSLNNIHAECDFSSPKVYTHLITNPKRKMIQKEKELLIQRENNLIMERMAKIHNHENISTTFLPNQLSFFIPFDKTALKTNHNKKFEKKIHTENQELKARIKAQKPNYSAKRLSQDYNRSNEYKSRLQRRKLVIPGSQDNPKCIQNKEEVRNQSEALAIKREAYEQTKNEMYATFGVNVEELEGGIEKYLKSNTSKITQLLSPQRLSVEKYKETRKNQKKSIEQVNNACFIINLNETSSSMSKENTCDQNFLENAVEAENGSNIARQNQRTENIFLKQNESTAKEEESKPKKKVRSAVDIVSLFNRLAQPLERRIHNVNDKDGKSKKWQKYRNVKTATRATNIKKIIKQIATEITRACILAGVMKAGMNLTKTIKRRNRIDSRPILRQADLLDLSN